MDGALVLNVCAGRSRNRRRRSQLDRDAAADELHVLWLV